MRFTRFAFVAAIVVLAGCQQQAGAPTAPESAAATDAAAPEAKPGLTLTRARMVLPAVKGRPAAAYFELSNASDKPVTLASGFIEGAGKTEMHETKGGTMSPLASLEVKPGETVKFERGGKHLMAFDLDATLTAGAKTELTLTFSDGDKLSAPLPIEAAGGTADSMKGMEH